ncbi:MAG: NADH-quinone oxidoreductase subunit L [Fibrobacteres bacterium]|nr:NADH-quinone oxidoreductase subunit L [Fibrobacterota bacterium]
MDSISLASLCLGAPLVAAVVGAVFWRKTSHVDLVSIAAQAIGAIAALAISLGVAAPATRTIPWLSFPGAKITFSLGIQLDALSVPMLLVVQFLALGVLVFSRWYLHNDRFYGRFFASFSFFVFAMTAVVVAPGLLQAFIGWELVGLGSYLLIGYWHDKAPASEDPEYQAGKPVHATGVNESKLNPAMAQLKAFVVNRVGDFGFVSGLAMLAWLVSSLPGFTGGDPLAWKTLFVAVGPVMASKAAFLGFTGAGLLTFAGLLVFLGAMGKSAQFPFHVWLPEAMQGPTTASAIIHAATMVAAGVFLTARIYPLLTPDALVAIQWVGAITAFVAATIACVQWDYKAVLAYSTISQLGYMMLGLGAGAAAGGYGAGVSHLYTHAIFKCMLFLGAAAVIHALHGVQDLGRMGGLARKMPFTAIATGIGTLAILGVPGFSAFWSKDAILAAAQTKVYLAQSVGDGVWAARIPWLLGMATAALTAFYMSRQWLVAFLGKPRDKHLWDHAHDPDKASIAVLLVLAALSLQFVWTGSVNPFSSGSWLDGVLRSPMAVKALPHELSHHIHLHTMGWTFALLCLGFGAAFWLYVSNPRKGGATATWLRRDPPTNLVWQFLANLWFVDKALDLVFAEGIARRGGRLVAKADLGSGLSMDTIVDNAVSSARWVGRFANLFQTGRSLAYAGWTLLALFGALALLLL